MTTIKIFALGFMLLLAGASSAFAQTESVSKQPASQADAPVTVSISAKGVRFAAPGALGQMRLEVFNDNGDSLYNSEFQAGTVHDWSVQDMQGQALPDGSYLCVITLRDLSGRLSVKQGQISVQHGQASLQLSESVPAGGVAPEKTLAQVKEGNETTAALLVHNGRDAQLVSTHGGLTFRIGDFFGGQDKELMRLTPDGNLGVGVSSPQARLDVAGDIRATGLLHVTGIEFANGTMQMDGLSARKDAQGNVVPATAGTGTQNRFAKWTDNAGTLGDAAGYESGGLVFFGQNNAGQVAPLFPSAPSFHVLEVGAPSTKTPLVLAGGSASMEFWRDLGGGTAAPQAAGAFGLATPGLAATNDIVFSTYTPGQPWNERMRITNGGLVGIGTANPQAKLDVAGGDLKVSGNVNATGTITGGNVVAQYQDVAEWVPARAYLAPGTVVSLDTMRRNVVMVSMHAYDTHVAGVVSAQPGVILGQGGAGKALVATTGRVRVKVDATSRPIRVGDLLVTSSKPGVAMRSRPVRIGKTFLHRPGTIIGKALEPLAHGQGEILVLLSLQ